MPPTKTYRTWFIGVVFAGVWLMLKSSAIVLAQDDQNEDPPSRVARMNYAQGSVTFQPSGEGDWVNAIPNRPLTSGDNLWTDQGSRAELHIGSTAVRLAPETSMTLLDLDDRTTQLRLSEGAVILRVRHLDDGDLFEVDTPNLAFNLQRTGEYRIDVNGNGDETNISVWRGRGEVTGGGYSYTVVAGQSARFSGTDQLNYDIAQMPASDDFDNWAFQRDHREDGAESANYVSPEMTGYEDLDDYGRWQYVGHFGTVWVPSGVASDWAPYRNGHWAYIDPWGWTWVEDEPWGFAPFHYGRWAYAENRWCWVPGPVAVRPVYAPALVVFVGGGRFALQGGPGVAWFPLAPGEVYVPYYRGSPRYVERVNVTNTVVNVTRVTNVYNLYNSNQQNVTKIPYANQRMNQGVTAVSRDTFVNARPVARNLGRFDARQLDEAVVERGIAVQPVRASVLGAGTPARAKPPESIMNRRVVATQKPTSPKQPFEQRQAAINDRTEQPNAQPRPLSNQGNARPLAPPHPPVSLREPVQASGSETPSRPEARPQRPIVAPRMTEPTPSEGQGVPSPQARENQNEPREDQNTRPSQAWSHPQARPAPPVQERSAAQTREDENKFRNWQQQRQQVAPGQKRAPQGHGQQPRPAAEPRQQENRPKPPSPN
jgi:hypothetical protein